MKMRSAFVLVFAALSLAGAAHGQQREIGRYTRVLLPFHASVRSADGIWEVRWWIRNDGDLAVDVFPVALGGGLPPPPRFRDHVFIAGNPAVRPQSTLKSYSSDALPSPFIPAFVPVKSNTVGAFLYVEESGKSSIAIGGTLGWRSSVLQPPSTPLRAIAASAFVTGRHSIVAVPSVPGVRYDLRIYALPETVTTTGVAVRVYDTQAPVLSEDDLLVHAQTGDLEFPVASLSPCFDPCDVPTSDLAPASLQVIRLFEPPTDTRFGGPQTFRIEIEPESPQLRWWAVLSTLDLATRQVILYQPSF